MIGKNYKPPDEAVMGAPTKYKPEYCQRLLDYFNVSPHDKAKNKDGEELDLPPDPPSIEGFADSIGVVKKTIYSWSKKHPDFLHCMNLVRQKERLFIRYAGLTGVYDSRFCASVYASVRNESPNINSCKTIRNKIKKIQEALSNDEITEVRAESMKNMVLAEAQITQVCDLDQRMKAIERKDKELTRNGNKKSD